MNKNDWKDFLVILVLIFLVSFVVIFSIGSAFNLVEVMFN